MTNKCKGLNLTKWWEKNKNNSARGKERDEMENPDNQNLNDFVDIEAGRENFGTGQIRPGSINKNFIENVSRNNANNIGGINPNPKSTPLFISHKYRKSRA